MEEMITQTTDTLGCGGGGRGLGREVAVTISFYSWT